MQNLTTEPKKLNETFNYCPKNRCIQMQKEKR